MWVCCVWLFEVVVYFVVVVRLVGEKGKCFIVIESLGIVVCGDREKYVGFFYVGKGNVID